MPKLTIRYTLVATAVTGVCVAIIQLPWPSAPFEPWHLLLTSWPIRTLALLCGISTFMHLLTSALGLKGAGQWAFAIFIPTSISLGWYLYSTHVLKYEKSTIGLWGHIQLGIAGSTIGFTLISLAVAVPQWIGAAIGSPTKART